MRPPLTLVLTIVLAVLVAACGDGDTEVAAPERVPDDLLPEHLLDGSLGVFENTDESTQEALANTDPAVLTSDTRVWEIRRGDRLVGTVQISTVLPEIDLTDLEVRERLVDQIILGQKNRIRVRDVEVFTTTSNDKTTYVWFASNLFEVMQTKDRELDPEELVTDLIDFQTDQDGWEPLPQLLDFEQ